MSAPAAVGSATAASTDVVTNSRQQLINFCIPELGYPKMLSGAIAARHGANKDGILTSLVDRHWLVGSIHGRPGSISSIFSVHGSPVFN